MHVEAVQARRQALQRGVEGQTVGRLDHLHRAQRGAGAVGVGRLQRDGGLGGQGGGGGGTAAGREQQFEVHGIPCGCVGMPL
jgi:hypothetical protein